MEMIPVYVINLRRSEGRRKFITRELSKAGIEFEFIEAFDAISNPTYVQHVAGQNRGLNLSKGHVGCVLSHISVWKLMEKRGDRYALIMEDDVIVSKNLRNIIERTLPFLKEDNICHVSMQVHNPIKFITRQQLKGKYQLCDCEGSIEAARGTQAYIISTQTASRLASELYPVKYNVDEWPKYQELGFFKNLSVIFPFPVIHGEFLSDLNEESFQWRPSLKENIKFLVYKYKLWPFYQFFLSVRRKRVERRHKGFIKLNGQFVNRTYKL